MKRFLTKWSISLFLVVGMTASMIAQKTISGTVTDAANNEALIGANVLVKGSGTGTITDIDGSYALKLNQGDVLIFSYTGYVDQEITVGTSSTINISLASGQLLDEVVVVGYGTVKKRDLTGSVASLKEKDFNQGVIISADQLLQNRVAGVNIINNSGQPGGETTVKIRGNNSIRAGAGPLYVIDGVPLDGRTAKAGLLSSSIGTIANSNPLNFINPTDISSIDVLKDASAAAIYGSRASNGVILITTKKAQSGAPRVDFSTSFGVSNILKRYDVLSGDEYRNALGRYNDAAKVAGKPEPFKNADGSLKGDGKGSVNALDEILRTGTNTNYNLGVGGGSENATYRFSLGYQDVQGIIKDSGLKRYTASINSNFKLMDGLLGIDALMIVGQTNESIAPISTDAGFAGNLVGQALQWNPTIPLRTADGAFTSAKNNPLVGSSTINPLNLLAAHREDAKTTTTLVNISPYINITDNLVYRYRLGVNYGVGTTRGAISGNVNVEGVENEGFAAISSNELLSTIQSHTLNFNKKLSGDINFDALAGFEYQRFDFKGYALSGRKFSIIDFDNDNALQNSANANKQIFSFANPLSELQSYFGRINLGIKGKYNLTATVRADGSSKFGANNRYGIFPSFGASWNVKSEEFLKDVSNVSDLRVRAGWGLTGNQEFPAGSAQERYGLTTNGGVILENVANPDLKWESSTTLNFGLDYGLFNNKVTGSIDYYSRVTNDLLLDPSVSEPGPEVKAWKNINGEVLNTGLELGINVNIISREKLGLYVGGNVSFLKNEFRNYVGPPILTGNLFGQGSSGAFVQKMENGYPLNTFLVREFTGLNAEGVSTYKDDGNSSYYFGNPNATTILGLTTGLDVNKLSLVLNFNGAFGHTLYNNTSMSVIPITNLGTRNVDASLIASSEPLESTANAISSSSRYLENGDFLKLSNASLAYNFGNISKLKNVRLSLTGQNLFVVTNYKGFDPEVNTVNLRSGIPSSGIEYIPYPSARGFIVGLNVTF